MGLIQCIIATDEFVTAWQKVHAAVANNSKPLIFWCPNYDTVENIQPCWPGAEYVDIVGMDDYPPAETAFASVYGAFCDGFAARYNKHFCIGETGSFNGGTLEAKEAWVSQLSDVDLNRFPCYKSITWFEYLKASDDGGSEYDYRIIQGQLPAPVEQTLSNFRQLARLTRCVARASRFASVFILSGKLGLFAPCISDKPFQQRDISC